MVVRFSGSSTTLDTTAGEAAMAIVAIQAATWSLTEGYGMKRLDVLRK